jgi:hypothetical protein
MTANSQSDRSPAPGIIPEPAHLSSEIASPSAATTKPDSPKPGRRNPVKIAIDRVMSALHGDKYMVDAYPPAEREAAAASDDAGSRAG